MIKIESSQGYCQVDDPANYAPRNLMFYTKVRGKNALVANGPPLRFSIYLFH